MKREDVLLTNEEILDIQEDALTKGFAPFCDALCLAQARKVVRIIDLVARGYEDNRGRGHLGISADFWNDLKCIVEEG